MNMNDIKTAVSKIAEQFQISRVVLFGSQADGTATENSDVDLIIEFSKPITLLTLSMVKEKLEDMLNKKVDVIHGSIRKTDMFEIKKEIEIRSYFKK